MSELSLLPAPEKDTLYEQFVLALILQQYQEQKHLHLQREQMQQQREQLQIQRERLQQQREQMRHNAKSRVVRPPEDVATAHKHTGGGIAASSDT